MVLIITHSHSSSVKRIVVTSSCAAVYADYPDARVFSEKDWNEQAVQDVQENGRNAMVGNKYRASKTLAEKAAWAFVKENKIDWDLVVLNPPYVSNRICLFHPILLVICSLSLGGHRIFNSSTILA